jgi:hypothetical protein
MSIFAQAISLLLEAFTKHQIEKATSANIEADIQKDFTLRMQKAYHIVGWICIGIAAASLLPIILGEPITIFFMIGLPFFILFFGGAGVLFILYYRNHQVVFDDTYIIVTNPLKKVTTSRWDKLVKTKFNITTGLVTLTDEDGQQLKLNQHLIGLKTFAARLAAKTGLHTGIEF